MKPVFRLSIYAIIALTICCQSVSQNNHTVVQAAIQKTLDSLVLINNVPGINFSYIDSTGRQFDLSAGFENVEKELKLSTDQTMLSGSVGKTYAAAIVFQLLDEGRIKKDDKILDHLPKDEWLNEISNIENITIDMLLSHSSGLPRWVLKPEVWDAMNEDPEKIWSYEDRFSFIFNADLVHPSGEGWAYSDTNYLLLGYLIESILGKDYYTVVKERILSPYELDDSFPSTQRKIERMAMGYSQMPESFKVPNEVLDSTGLYFLNPQVEWTGGGMASTTADLVKWTDIYYTGDVMSDEARQLMTGVHAQGKYVYQNVHSYGMGSFIYSTSLGTAYGHSGFMPGYNTITAYFPEQDISASIQINCDYAAKKMSLLNYLETCLEVLE